MDSAKKRETKGMYPKILLSLDGLTNYAIIGRMEVYNFVFITGNPEYHWLLQESESHVC